MAAVIKRLGGILPLLMLTWNLNAQVTHPIPHTNASWGQFLGIDGWGFSGGTSMLYAAGDSVINGETYVRISNGNLIEALLRQDTTGKVWIHRNDSTEFLLYNFNALPGETVTVLKTNWEDDVTNVTVLYIDTVVLNNGEPRKRLHLNEPNGGGFFTSDSLVWIEGIGSNGGLLYPAGGGSVVFDALMWLTCFIQNDTLQLGDSCNLVISSTAQNVSEKSIRIFPNPSNGIFNVELLQYNGGTSHIIVQNTIGQIVFQTTIETTNGLVEIHLHSVPNGFYTIIVRTENGLYNSKVFIQN